MSDVFYRVVRALGRPVFWVSSRAVVVGAENVPRTGPVIIAATHQSPFDVPLMIAHTPRPLDFVSIVEVFRKPVVGWFYGNMNAFPLDRWKADAPTVRIIMRRLEAGRAIAMFPEGALRPGDQSALHTRRIRPGIGRLAAMAGVPVVPCVIANSGEYSAPSAWLPLRRTRYGVIYGAPMSPSEDHERFERELVEAIIGLNEELKRRMLPRAAMS